MTHAQFREARTCTSASSSTGTATQLVTPEVVALLENYNKTINIEGQLMVLMANRYILPAALEYQKQIALSVSAVRRRAPTRSPRGSSTRAAVPNLTPLFVK